MPACPSAEQIAQYQRDGCLETFEREQGDAFGRDEYGNFDLEPRPACDCEPASRAAHAASTPTNC
jgi:hypothetical protein